MRDCVKANFSVEDPNAIIAERLPNGQPGILGVINNKESSVADVTADLNFLNWNMPRMFALVVISQNIIKFGGVLPALACLFILIGLKLASPIMAALEFDDKLAAQTFYPFCWGVATFCLSYPICQRNGDVYCLFNRRYRAFDLQRERQLRRRTLANRRAANSSRFGRTRQFANDFGTNLRQSNDQRFDNQFQPLNAACSNQRRHAARNSAAKN